MAKREKRQRNRGSKGNNRNVGQDFLKQNKQKPDVIETESGLQYIVLEQNDGDIPTRDDHIKIHQHALLLNGTVLEDTYRENMPETVAIAELIPGLQEGLLLMRTGSRYRFWVPPELAWGKKGTGSKIPPNAVLFFDIRLLEIVKER